MHTPGEWRIIRGESVRVVDDNGATIATLGHLTRPHQGPRRSPEEIEANARIIAAAPELLSTAKDLISEIIQDVALAAGDCPEKTL